MRGLTLVIHGPGLPPKRMSRLLSALDLSYGSTGGIRSLVIWQSPPAVSMQLAPRTSLLKRTKRDDGVWPVSSFILGISTTCPRIMVLNGLGLPAGTNLACRCVPGRNLIQRNTS